MPRIDFRFYRISKKTPYKFENGHVQLKHPHNRKKPTTHRFANRIGPRAKRRLAKIAKDNTIEHKTP